MDKGDVIHETNKKRNETITEVNIDILQLVDKYVKDKELSETLKKAEILLIPIDGYGNCFEPLFPEGTMAFYHALKRDEALGKGTEICIEDSEYKELALHAEVISLPLLIVLNGVLFPILATFIKHYIEKYILNSHNNPSIKASIVKRDGQKYTKINFEGDAKSYLETLKKVKDD